MSFSSYAALARRLDAVRRNEAQQIANRQQELETGRAGLDELVNRLTEQQTAMHQAARELRFRMPRVDPPPSTAVSARDALAAAQTATDTADKEREHALLRAQGPILLPTWAVVPRNAVIYGACAGVAFLFQMVLTAMSAELDTGTTVLWSLFGLPAIAFFIGYALTGVLGTPRIPPKPPTHDEHGLPLPPQKRVPPPLNRSRKLGFIICFVALPVLWLVMVALR